MQASAVEISKVNKFYGPFHALRDVDLSIPPGKVTCLIGPSGWREIVQSYVPPCVFEHLSKTNA